MSEQTETAAATEEAGRIDPVVMCEPDLTGFADDMLQISFEAQDVDGADIQEIALKHGLIKEVLVHEPCSFNCTCSDGSSFPLYCYRKRYST